MILVLAVSFMFAFAIGIFVLLPLLSAANQVEFEYSYRGFADEQEMRTVLDLRDAALHKLLFGKSAHPSLQLLNIEHCFEILVSICVRLQHAELPYLPEGEILENPALHPTMPQMGALQTCLIAGFIFAASNFFTQSVLAQALPPAKIPQAFVTESNTRIPQVSQFVLSPRMGELHVFYLGVFSSPQAIPDGKISLPFPLGFQNLKLSNLPNALFDETSRTMPSFTSTIASGITEIRAEFDLNASNGKAHWENVNIPNMYGTTLVILPEYDGLIHNAVETFLPDFNFWPARIVNVPTDFQSTRTVEQFDPQDPNAELLAKMPPQYTRNMIRNSAIPRPYPSFDIVGLVPSRTPLYGVVIIFGSVLFGVSLYTISTLGKKNRVA